MSCLGGDSPRVPGYFDPNLEEDVFVAFRDFVTDVMRRSQAATDRLTRSLVGAGRLLSGDFQGAFEIVEHLPVEPPLLDHGGGHCLVASAQALAAALPTLPAELANTSRWLAGSREQAALREWLEQHRAALEWNERGATYLPAAHD